MGIAAILVIWPELLKIVRSYNPQKLYMKFGFDGPSGFESINLSDLGQRSNKWPWPMVLICIHVLNYCTSFQLIDFNGFYKI